RAAFGALAAGVAAALVVPNLAALRLAVSDVYLRGAFELTEQAYELAGAGEHPVYWGADGPGGVQDFTVFPNTWMAFGVPLERSFGVEVLNVQRGTRQDFEPDEMLRARAVPFTAACAPSQPFVLLEVVTVGGTPAHERLDRPGVTLTPMGSVTEPLLFLTQPPGEKGWHSVPVTVVAWEVSVAESVAPTSPPCWLPQLGGFGRSLPERV
ncbi:MAG TPA: hypothetical protein PKB06_09600, partial [Actinotalea sp.]|nr:hypothetical protein [Actinotalea sp.]